MTMPQEGTEAQFLLVAEDNPADVGLIRLALERHGIDSPLHVVQDGEAAVNFIESVQANTGAYCPALAILDLNLPRLTGDEILRRMRACERWRNVPVIVVSSSLAAKDRTGALSLGASAYFTKPSELDQFLSLGTLVREVLGSVGHAFSRK